MKKIITIIKWLGVVTELSTYLSFLPESFQGWGIIAFAVVSALKDTLYKIGDKLDDGKLNKSLEVE